MRRSGRACITWTPRPRCRCRIRPIPFNKAGTVLGEDEIALSPEFEKIGKLGLMGIGVEPGMADWYCRYAADHFFDEIDEIGVRDGANLEIPGFKGISFGFSIWMTIEECTNPAVVWERDRGFYTVPPLSDPEPFYLPEGIGWVEVAHVEHEEVLARRAGSQRLLKGVKKATFKYALGDEFIAAMDVFKSVNLHSLQPVTVQRRARCGRATSSRRPPRTRTRSASATSARRAAAPG